LSSSSEQLISAAAKDDVDAMSAIAAEEGANVVNVVDYRDGYGFTALMCAAGQPWNRSAAVRWLIDRNANLKIAAMSSRCCRPYWRCDRSAIAPQPAGSKAAAHMRAVKP